MKSALGLEGLALALPVVDQWAPIRAAAPWPDRPRAFHRGRRCSDLGIDSTADKTPPSNRVTAPAPVARPA